jgi:hypothetical protein
MLLITFRTMWAICFSNQELLKDPWHLFQLDRDRYDSFHQVWLMDRAVEHGFLWAGHYITHSFAQAGSSKVQAAASLPTVPQETALPAAAVYSSRVVN